ncbi:hypothetical protein J7M22_12915 [Candidatus Poribacteria bacterium]|nr:hypothetical protein [Candidatus Poribacteria bacterium]
MKMVFGWGAVIFRAGSRIGRYVPNFCRWAISITKFDNIRFGTGRAKL